MGGGVGGGSPCSHHQPLLQCLVRMWLPLGSWLHLGRSWDQGGPVLPLGHSQRGGILLVSPHPAASPCYGAEPGAGAGASLLAHTGWMGTGMARRGTARRSSPPGEAALLLSGPINTPQQSSALVVIIETIREKCWLAAHVRLCVLLCKRAQLMPIRRGSSQLAITAAPARLSARPSPPGTFSYNCYKQRRGNSSFLASRGYCSLFLLITRHSAAHPASDRGGQSRALESK